MPDLHRREVLHKSLVLGASTTIGAALSQTAVGEKRHHDTLQVAAIRFGTLAEVGDPTSGCTGSRVVDVAEPLKTTVLLLKDGSLRVCIIATDLEWDSRLLSRHLQDVVARKLDMPPAPLISGSSD